MGRLIQNARYKKRNIITFNRRKIIYVQRKLTVNRTKIKLRCTLKLTLARSVLYSTDRCIKTGSVIPIKDRTIRFTRFGCPNYTEPEQIYWAKVITQLCFILIISLFLAHVLNKLLVQSVKHLTEQWFWQSVSNCSRNKPFYGGRMVEKKKMKCMVMYQYPTCDLRFVRRKRWVGFWDKMFYKCSSLI